MRFFFNLYLKMCEMEEFWVWFEFDDIFVKNNKYIYLEIIVEIIML